MPYHSNSEKSGGSPGGSASGIAAGGGAAGGGLTGAGATDGGATGAGAIGAGGTGAGATGCTGVSGFNLNNFSNNSMHGRGRALTNYSIFQINQYRIRILASDKKLTPTADSTSSVNFKVISAPVFLLNTSDRICMRFYTDHHLRCTSIEVNIFESSSKINI